MVGGMNQDISVTLNKEGVYVYQCDPHAMMAMVECYRSETQ